MPAYYHIYNTGIEARVIFADDDDFTTFVGFLRDYLTPYNPESNKKTFQVKGKTFRGLPHQPKNYFDKVELVAYNLSPNHFHLVLNQLVPGSIEGLMRSLGTRYSMYFNKKYKRGGMLFTRPYKSIVVADSADLHLLTRFLHNSEGYSSYHEYLGTKVTSWIKPVKPSGNYKEYVEHHTLSSEEAESLQKIAFDLGSGHLERSSTPIKARSEKRVPEYIGAVAVFLILLTMGIRNINVTNAKGQKVATETSPNESVLSESTSTIPTPTPPAKITLSVKDVGGNVPIRSEPSAKSAIIGEAKRDENFEYVSINSGWFGIKLADGSTGYIFSDYVDIVEPTNP